MTRTYKLEASDRVEIFGGALEAAQEFASSKDTQNYYKLHEQTLKDVLAICAYHPNQIIRSLMEYIIRNSLENNK